MICKVCNSENTKQIVAKDNGTGNSFSYTNCNDCGLLALNEIPHNYSIYYSDNYYSFKTAGGILQKIKLLRDKYEVVGNNFIGKVIALLQPNQNLKSLKNLYLNKEDSLLDIGCGAGNEIKVLRQLGFSKTIGIDPFINQPLYFNDKLLVDKKDINDVMEKYNFITMHHSFEHVIEPLFVLEKINDLMIEDGVAMIRIPVANSYALETYGTNWVQFDAPRHVFLHTSKSMKILCSKAGLEIKKIIYDSTAFQFWGSNLVKAGYSIHNVSKTRVLQERVRSFFRRDSARAKQINRNAKGDQAIFIIKKSNLK